MTLKRLIENIEKQEKLGTKQFNLMNTGFKVLKPWKTFDLK